MASHVEAHRCRCLARQKTYSIRRRCGDQDLPIDFSEPLGIHFPLVNGWTNRFVDSIALYGIRVRIVFNQEVAACQRQRWTEEIL
jgi:hypothetical protein